MTLKEYQKKLKKEYQDSFKNYEVKPSVHRFKFKWYYAIFAVLCIGFLGLLIQHAYVESYNSKIDAWIEKNAEIRNNPISMDSSKLNAVESNQGYKDLLVKYGFLNIPPKKTSILQLIFMGSEKNVGSEGNGNDLELMPPTTDMNQGPSSFQTNVQTTGIDEADIAKSDGTYIYALCDSGLKIFDLNGNVVVTAEEDCGQQLFLYENKIITLGSKKVMVYEFQKNSLSLFHKEEFESYVTARRKNNFLYIVTSSEIEEENLDYEVCFHDGVSSPQRLYSIRKLDLETGEVNEVQSLTGSVAAVYASENAFYLASRVSYRDITAISMYSYDLEPIGVMKVQGSVLNQFSMDEFDSYFRVAYTNQSAPAEELNAISIFSIKDQLKEVGSIKKGIGKGHQIIKSVRFEKETCYVVTYLNTDPLYEIDCSNPEAPKIVSAYEAPGYSNYLHHFQIKGQDYVLGLGFTDSGTSTKISVYQDTEETTQIGYDFILSSTYKEVEVPDYYGYIDIQMFSNHKALFFYQDEQYLYMGAKIYHNKYLIFKIDVTNEQYPVTIYKDFEISYDKNRGARVFLIHGTIYLFDGKVLKLSSWN